MTKFWLLQHFYDRSYNIDGFDQKTNFEGWPSLKFNNLRLVIGMALKCYCSVAKGLTLKRLRGGGQSI